MRPVDLEKLGTSSDYAFNIVCEAKVFTIVTMTKKIHPDWTKKQVAEFLKNAVDYAAEKVLKS